MMHSFFGIEGTGPARRGPKVLAAFGFLTLASAAPAAFAQNPNTGETTVTDESARGIGATLDPSSPQATALPGGMTPAFGQKSLSSQDWRFDFHGYITAPLNAGFNQRPGAGPGQSTTVLHAPPVVPDDFETFSHTGVVPTTYAQLNLSDGNNVVSANVSILARQANVSESFLEPSSQLGISDAFLAYLPQLGERVKMRIIVGAFTSRYGSTGEYDEGRYGTPLIARINGAGELVSANLRLSPDYAIVLEQGLQGQTNTAGGSITPDVWNNFANPEEGTTFVNHFHAGLSVGSFATVGAHIINAQSHDERATGTLQPDGSMTIVAADARFTMHRFGHLYGAVASTKAVHAITVSRILSVLNTPGGAGLANDYLGPQAAGGDATGTLNVVGGQYDLSLARLVNYPKSFEGNGPDVFISLFGMAAFVSSNLSKTAVAQASSFQHSVYGDGVTKLKFGAEASYSVLPWLALSARVDRVEPDTSDQTTAFTVISPRIILRTDWWATNQVVLQYSRWINSSLVTVRDGTPLADDIYTHPDEDVLSLSASMWW